MSPILFPFVLLFCLKTTATGRSLQNKWVAELASTLRLVVVLALLNYSGQGKVGVSVWREKEHSCVQGLSAIFCLFLFALWFFRFLQPFPSPAASSSPPFRTRALEGPGFLTIISRTPFAHIMTRRGKIVRKGENSSRFVSLVFFLSFINASQGSFKCFTVLANKAA